jgi:hypothetical protein
VQLRSIGTPWRVAAALSAIALVAGEAARAQDDEPLVAQQCVSHSMIRRTKIVDDTNILFYMRNGVVYNNVLPRQCPSLNPHTLVEYSYRGGQLCADSTVQIYWDMNMRQVPTFVCRIGMFVPLADSEVEALLDRAEGERRRGRRRARNAVKVEPAAVPAPQEEAERL